jgi:hypothetical protein
MLNSNSFNGETGFMLASIGTKESISDVIFFGVPEEYIDFLEG